MARGDGLRGREGAAWHFFSLLDVELLHDLLRFHGLAWRIGARSG